MRRATPSFCSPEGASSIAAGCPRVPPGFAVYLPSSCRTAPPCEHARAVVAAHEAPVIQCHNVLRQSCRTGARFVGPPASALGARCATGVPASAPTTPRWRRHQDRWSPSYGSRWNASVETACCGAAFARKFQSKLQVLLQPLSFQVNNLRLAGQRHQTPGGALRGGWQVGGVQAKSFFTCGEPCAGRAQAHERAQVSFPLTGSRRVRKAPSRYGVCIQRISFSRAANLPRVMRKLTSGEQVPLPRCKSSGVILKRP